MRIPLSEYLRRLTKVVRAREEAGRVARYGSVGFGRVVLLGCWERDRRAGDPLPWHPMSEDVVPVDRSVVVVEGLLEEALELGWVGYDPWSDVLECRSCGVWRKGEGVLPPHDAGCLSVRIVDTLMDRAIFPGLYEGGGE